MVRCIFQIFLLITAFGSLAKAEILFEGYSKILSGGAHVGFTVIRYEFDPAKKQFKSASFLKTSPQAGEITESLKSVSDLDLNPVSYEYTTIMGKKSKTIDAKFSKGKMTATVTEDGKTKTVRLDLPTPKEKDKKTILSSYLIYKILKGDNGLQVDEKPREYSAIAEEDAQLVEGDYWVEVRENHKGQNAFKIWNRFNKIKFISHVSDRGEVLSTQSPANGISTELMATPEEAMGAFATSAPLLKSFFGSVPTGIQNIVSKSAKPMTPPIPSKQQGVPGGQGIQIKGSPAPSEKSQ